MHPREIGSEYAWSGLPPGPFLPWPEPHVLYQMGRDCVFALWQTRTNTNARLWVPEYFCPEVAAWWRRSGVAVSEYVDNPGRAEADWESLRCAAGDFVLAVNYYGVRGCGAAWAKWHREHPDAILIEDHTHDPLSAWARNSQADFAAATIRKTFPSPDGAMLWSPAGRPLPQPQRGTNWAGSALKLAAFLWRAEMLSGRSQDEGLRTAFLTMNSEGDRLMRLGEGRGVPPWTEYMMRKGYPQARRAARERNTREFLALIAARKSELPGVAPLFTDWPAGHCPFNPVLVFATHARREAVRQRMVASGIFTPVHWWAGPDDAPASAELAGRLLTIPLDFRCGPEDVARAADALCAAAAT